LSGTRLLVSAAAGLNRTQKSCPPFEGVDRTDDFKDAEMGWFYIALAGFFVGGSAIELKDTDGFTRTR
ncbi:hypothetical protein AB9E19_33495, partial [Rhizobium leguminosarum]